MAYDEKLAERVRHALAHMPQIEEKKMFSGVAFLVDGKMCVNVAGSELMCRIDPEIQQQLVQEKVCRSMIMKGRECKGYVLINEEEMQNGKEFKYWIGLSLDFNKRAKSSKKKKKQL